MTSDILALFTQAGPSMHSYGLAYSTDLSDAEWQILVPLLPPAKPGGRHRKYQMREIINAIQYVLRGGCAWRLMPHDLRG
jgi:transposase